MLVGHKEYRCHLSGLEYSDGVGPSPKGGAEPVRPPLNPPLETVVEQWLCTKDLTAEATNITRINITYYNLYYLYIVITTASITYSR